MSLSRKGWALIFYSGGFRDVVLCISKILFNFVLLFYVVADILKVFSLLFLCENVEVFKAIGQTNSTHFLYSYVAMHGLCIYPILFKCGALYRLLSLRSFHNLHIDKRKSTPHFLFYK